jgi:hypothetical protein
MSPEMAARYGLTARGRGERPAAAPTPPPVAAATNNEPAQLVFSAQGSWQRDGDTYKIKLQDEKGKEESVEAAADDEKLTIQGTLVTLVFFKAD